MAATNTGMAAAARHLDKLQRRGSVFRKEAAATLLSSSALSLYAYF